VIPINDTIPHREFPYATWLLIIINGLVFLYETSLPEYGLFRFINHYGFVPARFTDPMWAIENDIPRWSLTPFVTSLFLHGNWLHFFLNVWTLWIFGDNVEDRMGKFSFILFYIICGVFGNIAHLIVNFHSSIPTIGASGAISAVMGAYMWLFPNSRIVLLIPIFIFPYFVEVPAFFYIGLWFIIQLLSGLNAISLPDMAGGIAWWTHIGGFVVGILLLPVFKKSASEYRKYYPDEVFLFLR